MKRNLIQCGKNLVAIVLLALVGCPLAFVEATAWWVLKRTMRLTDRLLTVTDGLRGKR